jgi:hypothetical protein
MPTATAQRGGRIGWDEGAAPAEQRNEKMTNSAVDIVALIRGFSDASLKEFSTHGRHPKSANARNRVNGADSGLLWGFAGRGGDDEGRRQQAALAVCETWPYGGH